MALYNDERPKRFGEVLGQELVVKQMKRKIAEGRFPQTVLATGPRGTGKTTCSRIIAKALNCENPLEDGEPCCECNTCKAIDKGASPTVVELDAATNNGVEDVRALVEQSKFVPVGKYLVFILDEVHQFSIAAWNALLKTLEEPPKGVVFILATTELQKVPVTVLSRCLRFEFTKISRETMSDYIYSLCQKYEIGIEPGALSLIVTQAEGCMRDALSLLEQFIGCEELETETVLDFLGLASDDVIFDVLMGMSRGDAKAAIEVIESCENRGKSILSIVKSILEALTYAAGFKAGGVLPTQSEEYLNKLVMFADSVTESKLNQITGTFLQVYPLLQKNAQLTFLLKAAIVNVVSSESLLCRLEKEVDLLKKQPVAAVIPSSVAAGVEPNRDSFVAPVVEKTANPVVETKETVSEDVIAFPPVVGTEERVAPVSAQVVDEFEDVPGFSDESWGQFDTGFISGMVDEDNPSPFDEEPVAPSIENPVGMLEGEPLQKPSVENASMVSSEQPVVVEGTQMVDGAAMSMDELMAALADGSLEKKVSAPVDSVPDNIINFRTGESASVEESEDVEEDEVEENKEDTPASAEKVVPQFGAFNFFMAGGSAWL